MLLAGPALADKADPVGEVSTAFKLVGPNHKILVEAFDDPKIAGVACYLARPKTGGVRAAWGWRRILPRLPVVPPDRPHHPARQAEGREEVFDVSTSLVFRNRRWCLLRRERNA